MGPVFDGFDDIADIEWQFEEPGCLNGATLLFAEYETGSYCGDAHVVFERDGQLFEVVCGHCSCHGLEGGWNPEATTAAAILMRPNIGESLRAILEARS